MTSSEILSNQSGEQLESSQHDTIGHYDSLKAEHENSAENTHEQRENNAQSARHEIEKITAEHEPRKHENAPKQHTERAIDSKSARKNAYDSIMKQARTDMSTPERAFSKVIHNPVIEKFSDFAGNTIARPDAILSGAIFAFLLTLVIYLVAKQSGYPLTGTETSAAFIIGWVIGNIYDFIKAMARGGR